MKVLEAPCEYRLISSRPQKKQRRNHSTVTAAATANSLRCWGRRVSELRGKGRCFDTYVCNFMTLGLLDFFA